MMLESQEVAAGAAEGRAEERPPRELDAAWRRAIDRILSDPPTEPSARFAEELPRELSTVVSAVRGEAPMPADAEGWTLILRRQLLERLRRELLRAWEETAEPPDARSMLTTLQRIEQARNAIDAAADGDFVATLADQGALDLVIQVVHDLRSPLTSILFLSETLRMNAPDDVQQRQLGVIYNAALGMIEIASDMIELAQGVDRLMEPQPSVFSIADTIGSVCDILQPMAEARRLPLRVHHPVVDQRLGNPVALNRVLLNLTTNALKFTEEGMVEISTRANGISRVEFSVRDTGPGIAASALKTLYQPFRRTPGRAGLSFSGTGLGLATCRRLVSAMGGELKVETRPNWGTRFYFELELPPASLI